MPNDLVDRARNILQLLYRISDSIPRPKTDHVAVWVPGFEWFSRPDNVYELATSLMLEERKSRFESRASSAVRQVEHCAAACLALLLQADEDARIRPA